MNIFTQPEPNIALLDKVLDQIQLTDEWSQGDWRNVINYNEVRDEKADRCKTAMCFAGWAVELDGGKWLYSNKELARAIINNQTYRTDALHATAEEIRAKTYYLTDHSLTDGQVPVVDAESRARSILGLTTIEADSLFRGENSLEDLKRIVGDIKSGASRLEGYEDVADEDY